MRFFLVLTVVLALIVPSLYGRSVVKRQSDDDDEGIHSNVHKEIEA